ncbi:hypothetical protein CKA55_07455 [Arcobacter suis]|uniref:Uncharacterized protein n=1 Tax=Arcobacter suis CECT 7833 TaxID=663365 RepID=A0AAD0SPK4_9BACT|nr:hypothetical protein ASUIS_0842 [Arcobacter suis CECT 7833]RWS46566.1 hypothetical protein CKA55_07455 [Arcobacter suis]
MYWGSDTFGRGKQNNKIEKKTKVSNKPSKIKSKHYKPNENSVNSFIFDLDIKLQIKSSSKKEGSQKIPKNTTKKGGK